MRRLYVPIQAVSLKELPRREMFGYLLVWSTIFRGSKDFIGFWIRLAGSRIDHPIDGISGALLIFRSNFLTARIDDTPLRLVTRAGVSGTLTNPWAVFPAWRANAWANSQFAYG